MLHIAAEKSESRRSTCRETRVLKLRLMGTRRVQMKGRSPSLVVSLSSSCRYKWLLSCLCLIWSAQYKIFFLHRTLFQLMCNHRPATWAGSRAGPPVSECVVSEQKKAKGPVAEFIDPWLGDKINYDIGLSHWHASLYSSTSLACGYDNPTQYTYELWKSDTWIKSL